MVTVSRNRGKSGSEGKREEEQAKEQENPQREETTGTFKQVEQDIARREQQQNQGIRREGAPRTEDIEGVVDTAQESRAARGAPELTEQDRQLLQEGGRLLTLRDGREVRLTAEEAENRRQVLTEGGRPINENVSEILELERRRPQEVQREIFQQQVREDPERFGFQTEQPDDSGVRVINEQGETVSLEELQAGQTQQPEQTEEPQQPEEPGVMDRVFDIATGVEGLTGGSVPFGGAAAGAALRGASAVRAGNAAKYTGMMKKAWDTIGGVRGVATGAGSLWLAGQVKDLADSFVNRGVENQQQAINTVGQTATTIEGIATASAGNPREGLRTLRKTREALLTIEENVKQNAISNYTLRVDGRLIDINADIQDQLLTIDEAITKVQSHLLEGETEMEPQQIQQALMELEQEGWLKRRDLDQNLRETDISTSVSPQ